MFHNFNSFNGFDRDPRRAFFGGGRGGFRGGRHSHGQGWGGSDWFGDFFGPPPRAERGGVRYLILDAVAEQPRHGYEIIQVIEQRSRGTYRPSPGVVYPTLQMLEELGHVQVNSEASRKVYAITEEGKKELAEHREEVTEFYDRSVDHDWQSRVDLHDLRHQFVYLLKSFKRAALRGHLSPTVQARVADVLRDSVQRIEAILRESEKER